MPSRLWYSKGMDTNDLDIAADAIRSFLHNDRTYEANPQAIYYDIATVKAMIYRLHSVLDRIGAAAGQAIGHDSPRDDDPRGIYAAAHEVEMLRHGIRAARAELAEVFAALDAVHTSAGHLIFPAAEADR
jgi:hypothetical protein